MSRGRAADIAIVGLGCRFPVRHRSLLVLGQQPGQPGPDRQVPADRWPLEQFYDPGSSANDRLDCRRGGYLDTPIPFNAVGQGIMPLAVAGGEPEQFLVLDTARAALRDAGIDVERLDRGWRRGRHRPRELLQPG